MYESYYKLKVSPFQLAPDSLFFYDSDTHRQGLIKLRQAFRNGNAITAIAGEPGTGKTELMRKFINELDANKLVIANLPLTSLRSSNILDYIASAFGVINMGFVGDALWSKKALLGKIQQEISSQAAEGKKFLVFIDNAESLSKNCMKNLLRLCSVKINGKPIVQCFLFGESVVSSAVNQRGNSDSYSFFSIIKLEPLGMQETRRYIEHRLMEAGWLGDPEITESAFSSIHAISEGVPWHINLLCHRMLLQGFLQNTHIIDDQIVRMFAGVDQDEPQELAQMEQQEQQDVAGSDVALASGAASKIVNLASKQTGSETKRTSFSSSPSQYADSDRRSQGERAKDSISYFFEDLPAIEDVDNYDEEPISIEEVEKAFAVSMGDDCINDNESADGLITKSVDEPYFPEVNDRIDVVETREAQSAYSIRDSVTNVSSDENKMTANILGRIFPRTTAMMEEYSQASNQKPRSRCVTPDESEDPVTEEAGEKTPSNEAVADYYQELPAPKSTFEIATRASIVTSLVITLVMWVISDTRAIDKTSSLRFENNQNLNSTPPSPFQNPDDLPRSRATLEK